MNVSYFTVQRHYSFISSSLPRYLSGCLTILTTHDQQPLAQKVTSGAANTCPQLRKLLDQNVTSQTVRNSLRKAGLKSAGKTKKPFLSRACMGGGWSLPWSTSPGLCMTVAGWFGQMRAILIGLQRMEGLGMEEAWICSEWPAYQWDGQVWGWIPDALELHDHSTCGVYMQDW